ncbi:MAG TPA: M56/M15 family metallopeptidase [Puia sp.]|nr:M56/M15 family metallopeptidase [Puia sp.]
MKEFLFTAAIPYLAKVLLASAFFYGYYRLFLRDKVFHQYNRFYLLGASVGPLLAPLVRLRLPAAVSLIDRAPVLVLHAIAPGSWSEGEGIAGATNHSLTGHGSGAAILIAVYGLTVLFALLAFLRQLWYIRRLNGRYPPEKLGPVKLYMTREPGTPFSFLNRLFWNEDIDMDSERGRQIFLHEWWHIRQRHTLDLLWLRLTMVFFWINPFFYLIYREIRTIHEYLADQFAVDGGDRYDYAELLVWRTVSNRSLSLLHPFFQSSIKRRITMLTRFHASRPGYISRMMVLPLTFLLLCAFAVRKPSLTSPPRLFTVVIDAGHGGPDNGAVSGDVKEKDLDLALALKVQQLAPKYHIHVVLTRKRDELAGGKSSIHSSLEYRAAMARDVKADLFVSLHVNNSGGGTPTHGFVAFVSRDNAHYSQSTQLASALLDAVKRTYATDENIRQREEGIYVLREAQMPAVLLECGSIDDPADLAFIRDGQQQEKVARDILAGIQRYQEAQVGR